MSTASCPSTDSPLMHIPAAFPGPTTAGDPLHPAVAGDDAELDLGLAEARVLRHDPVMGAHRQFVPAAESEPVDHGDDRHGKVFELREDGDISCGKRSDGFARLREELLDVRPGDA